MQTQRVGRYALLLAIAMIPSTLAQIAHSATPRPPCLEGICARYDISDAPFAFEWPAAPQVTREINVAAGSFSSLASAVAQSNVRVNVPAGVYNGSLSRWGNDVELVMSNGATINGSIDFLDTRRISWTGGNVQARHFNAGGGTSDMMFVDLNIQGDGRGDSSNNGNNWLGTHQRIAFVNCTIRYLDQENNSWGLLTLRAGAKRDWILANVRIDTTYTAFRLQNITNLVVVDSAFQADGLGPTGMRMNGVTNVFIRNVINRGAIHMNYSEVVNEGIYPDVTNLTALQVRKFHDQPGFAWTASGSTGSVRDSRMYTIGTSSERPASVSPFSGSGNIVTGWNGQTMPDVSNIGAVR